MANLTLRRGWLYGGVERVDEEVLSDDDLSITQCPKPGLYAGVSDQEVICPIDVSQLAALFIKCSEDVTIEVNDPVTPVGDPITLVAGRALIWSTGCGFDCPFAADVTALYVTHAGTTAPELTICYAINPTPNSPSSSGA